MSTVLLASGWAYDDVAMVLEITPSEVGSTCPYASRNGSGVPSGNVRQERMGLARAAVRLEGAPRPRHPVTHAPRRTTAGRAPKARRRQSAVGAIKEPLIPRSRRPCAATVRRRHSRGRWCIRCAA
ncbi:hypothetical protein [Streptomyces sp. NPDC087856]|uniref:hypothetical protein n=1 Tax=Streptomyces sp. NPDC087856 TaxID=3365811 RepID=UPI0037F7BAAF